MAQNSEELEHHTGMEPQLGGECEEHLVRYKIMGQDVDVLDNDLIMKRFNDLGAYPEGHDGKKHESEGYIRIDFRPFSDSNSVELVALEYSRGSIEESYDITETSLSRVDARRGIEILARHFIFLSIAHDYEVSSGLLILLSPRE